MSKILSGVVFVFSLLGSSVTWSDVDGARDTVIKVVDAFRTDIVADKAVLSKDPVLLEKRVDNILANVVDFDDFSKKVMGKYYRRASPEQRIRFASVTKDTLLKTYGTSLLELDADRINVLPLGPQGRGKETKVDVDFQMESGGMLNISFFMEESKKGVWMLSNVVINNINFGLTFRKQFGVMMEQNKNDIELAISAWRESLAKKS
ncbi:MAG: ABC transporter substrate-binding protein [Gammaproteobacteria bacterium]|jgi:phospholipid transport system substrate-binding protein|uniref:Phospholipid transport system substrate-binding protein n=1 Tax=Marinomonas polaris DSM 16579 TaxID=1122206 RepID=A0A1M5D2S8_9GAMM|nr:MULTISPECIES: ABC transporter substrate-binding protein [Marinomonas]MBU1296563.1 ABC transporter substrate-binding protein [Gammaproteobacteria bacterium]MBU1466012.1 ABC transporter substrate-binding protein [Gammaproteobacteria bacterium]MBU2021439.1 ABC transporter substrate-binding protein [Gammaproteobacteria bacterium]MBU2239602.1 ABC transporter substrate-binding protein [Gammaproteobacteria bacterium]MBU2317659.1 ABC transporter substrate-binding protein [Gammaproteobacteria bacter